MRVRSFTAVAVLAWSGCSGGARETSPAEDPTRGDGGVRADASPSDASGEDLCPVAPRCDDGPRVGCDSLIYSNLGVHGLSIREFLADPLPGVRTIVALGTVDEIAAAHARGFQVAGFHGLAAGENLEIIGANTEQQLTDMARAGYDAIIADEYVWAMFNRHGLDHLDAACRDAVAVFNRGLWAAKSVNAAVRVGVVEPFKAFLPAFLEAQSGSGLLADFVSGEDYGAPHPGDIGLAELEALRAVYGSQGVQVHQWVKGAAESLAYVGKVDFVIVSDVRNRWGIPFARAQDYEAELRRRLTPDSACVSPIAAQVRVEARCTGARSRRPALSHAVMTFEPAGQILGESDRVDEHVWAVSIPTTPGTVRIEVTHSSASGDTFMTPVEWSAPFSHVYSGTSAAVEAPSQLLRVDASYRISFESRAEACVPACACIR